MRSLLLKLLKPIFSPFRVGSRNYYRIRDIYYTNPAEHLHKVKAYVSKLGIRLSDFDTIVDIGAANGDTCRFFHRSFPTMKVYGFEPNPEMFALAQKQAESNNIHLINKALGEQVGEAKLHVTANDYSSSLLDISGKGPDAAHMQVKREVAVPLSKLDVEVPVAARVLILKIDTQGTELSIFRGGTEVLKRTKLIVVEMMNHEAYIGSAKYHEVDAHLRSRGFRLLDIIISYRSALGLEEYDAIYINPEL